MWSRTISYDNSLQALINPCAEALELDVTNVNSDASLCAELSRLVYCAFEKVAEILAAVTQQLAAFGYGKPEPICKNGLQAFITLNAIKRRGILVFRGTQPKEPSDLLTDLRANLVLWNGSGRVHQGFAQSLAAAWPQLEQTLAQHEDYEFFYTGHSLGAALATLAAALRRPAKLFTFGSPRVGNDEFADSMAIVDHERYVNCCDGVCTVPPKIASYRHVGVKKYFDRNGILRNDLGTFDLINDQAKAEATYLLDIDWKVPVRRFADHAPINYIYALRAMD